MEAEQGGTGGSGALYTTWAFNGWAGGAHTDRQYVKVNINASKSNAIYGRSTTVTPLSLSYLPVIKY